ncbi:MAG: hypothetical protein HY290_19230 [Planctomycetia bacterium]|nr:hypothetical protein [Planctomycetia bacterium]
MADHPVSLENISYRRLFPWLHLARAFWIAADFRKLILAAAALMLVSAGSLGFDRLPFASPRASRNEAAYSDAPLWPWQRNLGYETPAGVGRLPIEEALTSPRETLLRAASNWQIVLLPIRDVLGHAPVLFRGDARLPELADAATRLLWNLIVWSIFGGAICRIAALQFARNQQIGMGGALAFSLKKFLGYFSAPLMPLVAVALLWLLCVIGGAIGRIPGGVGEILLGVLWGLELLFGFLMSIVLIGVSLGWPLMFATISVEGTDGFDGLSRAYNYVFERPLYVLWQVVLTMAYGSLAIFLVWSLSQLLTQLAVWGVSWGLGHPATAGLITGSPELVFQGGAAPGLQSGSTGSVIAIVWMNALALLVVGFVYTFFWSSATIAYFILRHSVDANDFDEVYIEDAEEKDELLPLVGTAAMGEAGNPPAPAAPPETAAADKPVDLTP